MKPAQDHAQPWRNHTYRPRSPRRRRGKSCTPPPPTTRPQKAWHYSDAIMGAMASQNTSLTSVYWTVYSGAHQRKYQSPASLAFVRGIHRWPVNSPHKWPVTRKMFPSDDVIMGRKDWQHIKVTLNETRPARLISETHCSHAMAHNEDIYLSTNRYNLITIIGDR